jgi:hypothetical protein
MISGYELPESRRGKTGRGKRTVEGQTYSLRKIKSVKSVDVVGVPVYDFEVNIDHSFVANSVAVHNCFGCADCQTTTGVNWMKTGKRIEFDKFFHYLCCQYMADLKNVRPRSLGKDTGSIPSMGLIVAATWGYLPSSFSKKLGLGYPKTYEAGLRAYGPLLQQLKDPNSEVRKAMAKYKMDKYIPIKNSDPRSEAKRSRVCPSELCLAS